MLWISCALGEMALFSVARPAQNFVRAAAIWHLACSRVEPIRASSPNRTEPSPPAVTPSCLSRLHRRHHHFTYRLRTIDHELHSPLRLVRNEGLHAAPRPSQLLSPLWRPRRRPHRRPIARSSQRRSRRTERVGRPRRRRYRCCCLGLLDPPRRLDRHWSQQHLAAYQPSGRRKLACLRPRQPSRLDARTHHLAPQSPSKRECIPAGRWHSIRVSSRGSAVPPTHHAGGAASNLSLGAPAVPPLSPPPLLTSRQGALITTMQSRTTTTLTLPSLPRFFITTAPRTSSLALALPLPRTAPSADPRSMAQASSARSRRQRMGRRKPHARGSSPRRRADRGHRSRIARPRRLARSTRLDRLHHPHLCHPHPRIVALGGFGILARPSRHRRARCSLPLQHDRQRLRLQRSLRLHLGPRHSPSSAYTQQPKSVGLWTQRMGVILIGILPIILPSGSTQRSSSSTSAKIQRWRILRAATLPCLPTAFQATRSLEVCRRYLQAQGLMHAPTIVLIFVSPLNAIANYLLVWGPDSIRLGFIGAPIASAVSMWLMAVLCFFQLRPRSARRLGRLHHRRFQVGRHQTRPLPRFAGMVSLAAEWWAWRSSA